MSTMAMRKLLMVFVRNPVEGKVKTRLASSVGAKVALEVYEKLLDHTRKISFQLEVDKAVYYSDFIPEDDCWKRSGFLQEVQVGSDLGEKMMHAFSQAFHAKYNYVVIIGTDCIELSSEILQEAFHRLDEHDVVIGPAQDGGYYLLGMKRIHQALFQHKRWSSDSVLTETLKDVTKLNVSCFLLQELRDIDTEEDLNASALSMQQKSVMISVIVPVYNEEGVIGNTVRRLKEVAGHELLTEIIVADGGSTDNSVQEAQQVGANVVKSSRKGRAVQMNEGARAAKGEVLYFLHADSTPPNTFVTDICDAIQKGFSAGCYRLRFDVDHWFLKANAWFTRFDVNAFRFGDQSLFVKRQCFDEAGGFCEKHIVMEDQEIIKRLRKHGDFVVLPKEVITSARKYATNGLFKMQCIFYLIYFMYKLGYSQERLLATFRMLVRQDKL